MDRYGDEIELDLAFSTSYRLSDFFDGTATVNTLHNLLQTLRRRRTSYLAQAMANDMELYKASLDQPRPKNHPDLVEYDLQTSVLVGMHEILQQIRDFTAGAKKAKVKPLPRPVTAEQRYKRQKAKQAYEDVMSLLVFTDDPQQ